MGPCICRFYCSVFSENSNESEKLLSQGGYYSGTSYVALAFKSIRDLQLNLNYEYYVIASACLQQMIKSADALDNRLELNRTHVRCFRRLMDDSKRKKVSEYVLQVFRALGTIAPPATATATANDLRGGGFMLGAIAPATAIERVMK